MSCSVDKTEPIQVYEEPDNADGGVLDQEQRQYLWDIEHLAFVLEQKVFPKFKEAISQQPLPEHHLLGLWIRAFFDGSTACCL
jgi:hypothetical protein